MDLLISGYHHMELIRDFDPMDIGEGEPFFECHGARPVKEGGSKKAFNQDHLC